MGKMFNGMALSWSHTFRFYLHPENTDISAFSFPNNRSGECCNPWEYTLFGLSFTTTSIFIAGGARLQKYLPTCMLASLWIEVPIHDDVIKWKHFPRNWPFVRGIHRSPVNSPHKGQWRVALIFSLICVWINDWVNNREAGDLRRYRAHYDVTVMIFSLQAEHLHLWYFRRIFL